jgi:hypothetical protein
VLNVEGKGIEEGEPTLRLRGRDAGFLRPELRPGSRLDHVLVEGESGGAGAGQRKKQQGKPGAVLLLLRGAHQADAAATDQGRNLAVNAHELEEIGRLRGVIRRDENKAESRRPGKLLAQLYGRLTDDGFVERAGHQPRSRELGHTP